MNFTSSIKLVFTDAFSSGFKKASEGLAGMKGNMDSFSTKGKAFDEAAANMSLMKQVVDQTATSLKNIVNEPRKFAMGIEDSMAKVKSLLNSDIAVDLKGQAISVNEAYGLIKNSAFDFAKAHGVSADSFIDTSYMMISAGLDTARAVAATGQAVKLAKATNGEAASAADMLALVYNNMGDKSADVSLEMERLSDVLAKTQGTFQFTNLGQVTEGLKYAIPSAQQFGISIEQASAFVGQLNNAGKQGGQAGTYFSAMMRSMVKASKDLNFDLSYNISGDSSSGIDMLETLKNIKDVTGGINIENSGAFQKAFGDEGTAALSLLMNSLGELEENYWKVKTAGLESVRATEEMYVAMTDTASMRLAKIAERKNVLKTQMGELSLGSTKMGFSISSAWLKAQEAIVNNPIGKVMVTTGMAAAGFGGHLFGAVGDMLGFSASFLSVMSMLDKSGPAMQMIFSMGKFLGGVFGGIGEKLLKIAPAIAGWTASMWSAAVAHWAVIGPALAVIGVVALVAGAAYLIIKNWKAVSGFFVGLWKGIVSGVSSAWNYIWNTLLNNKWIQGVLAVFFPIIGIPILIIKNWGAIKGFFINLWNGVLNNRLIQDFLVIFFPIIGIPILIIKNWGAIKDFFGNLWKGIMSGVSSAWNYIWNTLLNNQWIQGVLAVFFPIIGIPILIIKNWGAIKGFFGNLWNGIVSGVSSAWNYIWNTLLNNKWIQGVLAVFFPIIGIPILIIKNWGAIKDFFGNLWSGVKKGASICWEGIKIGGKFAVSALSSAWSGITSFFSGLWSGIKNGAKSIWDSLDDGKTQRLLAGFLPIVGLPVMIIKNWSKIKDYFKNLFVIGETGGLSGVFKKMFVDAMELVTKIPQSFKEMWKNVLDNPLFQKVSGFFNKIGTFFSGNKELKDAGNKIPETMALGAKNSKALKKGLSDNFQQIDNDLLPHSDAKSGGFSRLTLSGQKIISTLAEGVDKENSLSGTLEKRFVIPDLERSVSISKSTKSEQKTPVHITIHADHLFRDIEDLTHAKDVITRLLALAGVDYV